MKLILMMLFTAVLQAQTTNGVITDATKMWGTQPKESLLKPLLNKYVVNEVIDIRPIDGHHFNLEANNNCNFKAPTILKEDFIQCQFDEAGKYRINAYVCDEKKSFCKFEKVEIIVTAPTGYKKALKKRVSSNILYVPKSPLKAPPGFIKDRDKFALQEAKKKDQPLLIVFSAQWCPACNMLNENVFQNKSFQEGTKGIVKLIIDVDSDLSWDLKEKFRVGAYPTTVLTTSTLNEIGRFVGYRSEKATSNWIKNQVALKDNPIEFIISKNEKGAATEKDLVRLAQWQLDCDDPETAKLTLMKVSSPEGKKLALIADYRVYENSKNDTESAAVLAKLLDAYPQDILASQWISSLAAKDPEAAKKRIEKVKEGILTWIKGKDVETSDFTKAELYSNLADAYYGIEDAVLARQNYANCAEEYKKLSESSSLKTPRGAQMERAFCLSRAGMSDEALKVFEGLAKVYRDEFAFNYYYARSLNDSGNINKAYEFAKKAYNGSYGDNMVRAAILKAQIEIDKKDLKNAELTVTRTLEKVYLPETTKIRSHRYVAHLKGVLAKIETQKEALKLKSSKSSSDEKKTE